MQDRTRLSRSNRSAPGRNRPVNPPVERATTLLMPDAAGLYDLSQGPVYGLQGSAAHQELREAVAVLEGAAQVALTPSGLAAVAVGVMAAVDAGDEVLAVDSLYGPTRRFLQRTLKRYGVATRFFHPEAAPEDVLALAGQRTRLILLESPGSLTFELQDVGAVARLARSRGIAVLADNSWAAGLLFKPLAHGADLSVQALTKYAAGHSDVFAGAVATQDPAMGRRVEAVIDDLGWFLSPDDAYLALRGIRTLPLRLAEQGRSALEVAGWLQQQPQVRRVLTPALPGAPGHDLWRRDFSGAASLFGVVLQPAGRAEVEAFLDRLQLFGLGFSWGGFESLATYEDPQLAGRAFAPELGGPLVRLHIGLEAPQDLIADLARALEGYASSPDPGLAP
jgi:cystathionine beta-lyase